MVKVVSKNTIKKEKIEEFIALVAGLVEATKRNDEGCIQYDLYQDIENPQILTIIEEWESKEALDKHMQAPHFKEIVPQFADFAGGPKELNIYKKA